MRKKNIYKNKKTNGAHHVKQRKPKHMREQKNSLSANCKSRANAQQTK